MNDSSFSNNTKIDKSFSSENIKPFSEMPGPSFLPRIFNVISFFLYKNPLDFLSKMSRKYGKFVRINSVFDNLILLQDPQWIQFIMQTNYKNFSKNTRSFKKTKKVLGNGLLTSDGEFWRKQRKLAQPAFHKEKLEKMSLMMIQCINSKIEEWDKRSSKENKIDFSDEMIKLTLNIITKTMFSSSLSEKDLGVIIEKFPAILRETNRRIFNPTELLDKIPTKDSSEYEKNIENLNSIVYKIIDDRKISIEKYDDLLGMFMDAVDEESGEGMTNEQLRDEIMTIFIAGHETTVQALCWSVFLLDQNPEIKEKLINEVQTVLGNRALEPSDFMKLPYTLMVFKEALRLYPPVALIIRSTENDFEMEGYHIPANTKIFFSPFLIHRNAEYWENPNQFNPERFTPEAEKSQPKFSYFPFGGGPRICMGNNFAMMEAVFSLAMIYQKYDIKITAPEKVKIDFSITLRPKKGLPVLLKKNEVKRF